MDPKIIKFYKDNGYNLNDFFDKKRHHGIMLTDGQIKAGARDYYNAIQAGEIAPKRISIGWGVIGRAKTARYGDFIEDNNIIEKYKPIIEDLERDIDRFKKSLLKYKVLFWAAFGVAFCLFFKLIDVLGGIPL